jgi:glucose-6-phosphate isomerase
MLAEALGKQGLGPTPINSVLTRDLPSRGQQHRDGTRDKFINNLVLKTPRHTPVMIGMMDHNEDDLNQFNRKGLPDLTDAAFVGANHAYAEVARPTADLVMPSLSEHTMGQLMQMLMLATVVEGRLMGLNPYSSSEFGVRSWVFGGEGV